MKQKHLSNYVLLLMSGLLTGCASSVTSPTVTTEVNYKQPNLYIDSALASFLQSATPNMSAAFPSTPWGNNVTLIVDSSYFSASGSYCHALSIEGASAVNKGLACSPDRNNWYKARILVNSH